MNKKCIVSFAANGREPYCKGLLRLIRSAVNTRWDGDYLMRTLDGYVDKYDGVSITNGSYPVTKRYGVSHNHAEIPFGFKLAMIQEAIEAGHTSVAWCDASITVEANINPVFDFAKKHGVAAFDNLGYPLVGWLSDAAQERLGISNEDLQDIQQIMACCIVFDFTNEIGKKVFEEWYERCLDGCSFHNGYASRRRGFVATRWDQSCLSGILWKNKVPLLPYGTLVYEPHDVTKEYGEEIYFCNRQIN